MGYFSASDSEYPVISLTEKSRDIIHLHMQITLRKTERVTDTKRRGSSHIIEEAGDPELFAALKKKRLELARIRLGVPKIQHFLMFLENWEELRVECGIEQKYTPSQAHYYRCLVNIGATGVYDWSHHLRGTCEQYQLYDTNVDIWDGRFLNSYSSGQKSSNTGQVSDPEVGAYVHGKKFIGIGYLESRIINSRCRLPK